MSRTDSKNNLLEHSEAKVRLLDEYIKRYLNVISNDKYTERIHIHDIFCGPGIYDDGGYGSPIVSLKQVKETYYSIIDRRIVKQPKINCYFNDIDKTRIHKLKESIEKLNIHYPNIGELDLTTNDYKNEVLRLKEKFSKFKNDKAFVFIDPYGYKDLEANHIKELLGTNKKSEVLIWQPIQFQYRFSKKETPAALKNLMNDLGIIESVKNSKNVWDFISILRNGFQTFLGPNFFVDHFSLKKEENTVFCLFFFTPHIKGFEKMLESKWEIDTEQGRGWEYSGNTPTLFHEQKTNDLELMLKEFIKSSKKYNSDIYEFTLRCGYLPKHAKEVLLEFQNSNFISVYLENGKLARKKSFYIKYYKPSNPDNKKVYFVIK